MHLHLHISPSQMNVNEPSNRCPPFDVVSRLLGRGKTSTLSNQRCSSPCTTFIFLLFTPLALFLARSCCQGNLNLRVFTAVKVPMACLILSLTTSLVMYSLYEIPSRFLKHLISVACDFFWTSTANFQGSQACKTRVPRQAGRARSLS